MFLDEVCLLEQYINVLFHFTYEAAWICLSVIMSYITANSGIINIYNSQLHNMICVISLIYHHQCSYV